MSTALFSPLSVQYYKTGTDLDMITTSPTRDAIFQYLAQVPSYNFPEFVLDILIHIEGHKCFDITDGPGDEKQDILTITPDGKRCLTQCKHKQRIDGSYSGDELDRIVAACMRKDCQVARFVTNGELSPQAKGYITDKRYEIGWPKGAEPLDIDYWNGYRIWEKIKANQAILNKWFSGMAQAHSLRNFRFDVSVIRMPLSEDRIVTDTQTLIKSLTETGKMRPVEGKENEYEAGMPGGVLLRIKKSLQFLHDLRININAQVKSPDFWRHPIPALSLEIFLPSEGGTYSPAAVKEAAIRHFFTGMPWELAESEWIYLAASQGRAFMMLHDIVEPRQLDLDPARTFVATSGHLHAELPYCNLEGKHFKVKDNDDNEEAIWLYGDTGISIVQLFEQSLDPVEVYDYQRQQMAQVERLNDYEFRVAEFVDGTEAMRIRRILPQQWLNFTYNDKALIWCYPKDTPDKTVAYYHAKLAALGIKVLTVKDEDKEKIIADLPKELMPVALVTVTDLSDTASPIDLPQRGFWISKDLELKKLLDIDGALKLLQYKFDHENKHGYDNMQGKERLKSHSSELPDILFDFFTVRCDSMIDIAIMKNPVSVNMRIFTHKLGSSEQIALQCIETFQSVYHDIENLMKEFL